MNNTRKYLDKIYPLIDLLQDTVPSDMAMHILNDRYFLRNRDRKVIENWSMLLDRVAYKSTNQPKNI